MGNIHTVGPNEALIVSGENNFAKREIEKRIRSAKALFELEIFLSTKVIGCCFILLGH